VTAMMDSPANINRKILVVDDNRAIHEDFAKILCRDVTSTVALAEGEAEIFGDVSEERATETYQLDSAYQGQEGLAMISKAFAEQRPYALAFVDVRMPPGWDGIETAMRIWQVDPNIQIVICTAYSDYSWAQMRAKLGKSDRLVVLKKPFDNIEVQQLADALTRKWQRAHEGNRHLATLQEMIRERSDELAHGGNRWAVPPDHLVKAAEVVDAAAEEDLVLENELRVAIERQHLSVHYQPLIDVRTNRLSSLEALVRWEHPTRGSISPARFIPIAEDSGLILAIGELVITTVSKQIRSWLDAGVAVVPIAVNVSAVQLQKQNIVELVRTTLRQTRVSTDLLALELTESALIENMEQNIAPLQALRADGVKIEMDDFGTGYSSLSYLKQLPVDALKIDRSFIRNVHKNPIDEAIISAIVAMAHSLNLRVVAEGVETEEQFRVIRAHDCDVAQGFLFARPMAAEECGDFLANAAERVTPTNTTRIVSQPLAMVS
jgi:EAL domain-containing protein (putative c-di-GMP-specific phosphodiesterase class I)/CheY-like chemotaxis protein